MHSLQSGYLIFQDASCVTDNAGVNIMRVGNETFVASETCYMRRIDHHTLETKEKVRFLEKIYQ